MYALVDDISADSRNPGRNGWIMMLLRDWQRVSPVSLVCTTDVIQKSNTHCETLVRVYGCACLRAARHMLVDERKWLDNNHSSIDLCYAFNASSEIVLIRTQVMHTAYWSDFMYVSTLSAVMYAVMWYSVSESSTHIPGVSSDMSCATSQV